MNLRKKGGAQPSARTVSSPHRSIADWAMWRGNEIVYQIEDAQTINTPFPGKIPDRLYLLAAILTKRHKSSI
jgi:hypothetical protein